MVRAEREGDWANEKFERKSIRALLTLLLVDVVCFANPSLARSYRGLHMLMLVCITQIAVG